MISGLNPVLAYAAGALTILSPCVLPLVPIVLGSAAQKHRLGPLALVLGLVASFTVIGTAVAVLGGTTGVDSEVVRQFGAAILLLVGLILCVPALQGFVSRITTPLADWAAQKQVGLERFGLLGQAAIGALLGLVWSPCVGPTLGAATVLAAQGKNLGDVLIVMSAFALGIATVLFVIAMAARGALARWRGTLMSAGGKGKQILGAIIAFTGVLILSGGDRLIEAWVLSASPDWLIDLATSL